MKTRALILAMLISVSTLWAERIAPDNYSDVVYRTASMVQDRTAQRLASEHDLRILNITWEDTGRFKNSAVGPNISDMTIQVEHGYGRSRKVTCMPVIRFPNFSDRSGDISADKFYLMVGNERGKSLKKISLKQFLQNPRNYLSEPDSWAGPKKSLWASRDKHLLVSAQACFLPIPQTGDATFNPVLFNYQSYEGNPAVLTILATREGTSVTVIDNKRDGFMSNGGAWGQRLFYNKDGERASFTGTRMSDFVQTSEGKEVMKHGTAAQKAGLNMVMLIQVPLKQKRRQHTTYGYDMCEEMAAAPMAVEKKARGVSNVENAVIGHGEVEGPFTEIDGLAIERDPAFPIRVTVQFYKATDNGIVSKDDMSQIAEQIERVYDEADYVGSLVVGGDTKRPTEYIGDKNEPSDWWSKFWKQHNENMDSGQYFGW